MVTTALDRYRSLVAGALGVAVSLISFGGCCSKVNEPSAQVAKGPPATDVLRVRRETDVIDGLDLRLEPVLESDCATDCLAISLRNRSGASSLLVNASLSPRYGSDQLEYGAVTLEITDPESGVARNASCFGRPNMRDFEEYLLFNRGTELRRIFAIHCYSLPAGTSWRVVARYKDKNTQAPVGPSYASWFRGELVSNEVIIVAKGIKKSPTE